jgi:UPF0755 protein
MKKMFRWALLLFFLIVSVIVYLVVGSTTGFDEKSKTILIKENLLDKKLLINYLQEEKIISNAIVFEQIGNQLHIWERIKSGKYKFKNGDNVLTIVKALKNNKQVEVNLVINKLRVPQDLAKLISKNFSTDSATALNILMDKNVLENINADSNKLLFNIIPNTYSFFWNTSVEKILEKLAVESNKFWDNNNRQSKADALGFSTYQIHTIASIVEEETNKEDEKGKVASVYINRYKKGMKLDADPTVKFALKDFSLKRIYEKHLLYNSPYNTYRNKGLPPGAICTPSIKTIDAVLNAPSTNYLFFCADASFNGYHHFTSNYEEHKAYAKQYQHALSEWQKKKAQ